MPTPSNFAPAVRSAAKARVALVGPPGSGKTYTALMLAHGLGGRIALIDSERNSASGYVGVNGWQFDTCNPASFEPDSLVDLLADAAATGHDVAVVDSLSHYWMGVGGMLEQVDRKSSNGNSFGGWKEARPAERRMVEALLAYPGHVIVTMRTKTEYVVEQNERGKSVPRKVGLKPEQRDGIEYEFRIVGAMDMDNVLTVTKSSIPTLSGQVIPQPGEDMAADIRAWYEVGESQPDANELAREALTDLSSAALKALGEKARRLGIGGAGVHDSEGGTVQLLDLIRSRFMDAHALEQQSEAKAS